MQHPERKDLQLSKAAFFDLLWKGVLEGKISTADYTKQTGKKVYSGRQRVYSKYTGSMLRQIRHNRARRAIDDHNLALDAAGLPRFDESRCLDLISA